LEVQNTRLREKHGQKARNGEQGLGVRDQGSGSYHLREAQVPYNSDFTTENSDLRADNAYF